MTDVGEWERAAAAVLRKSGRLGADDTDSAVWDKLTRRTLDGLSVRPLGIPGRTIPAVPASHRESSQWDVRVASAGGADALAELETGAASLWLRVPAGADAGWYDAALEGVLLDLAPVVLDGADSAAAAHFVSWLGSAPTPADGTGLGLDPWGDWLRARLSGASAPVPDLAATADLAITAANAGILAITVDGTAVHDAGGSDAWEVAVSLAAGVGYLRALTAAGMSIEEALGTLEFRYAVTDEQFPSIAKLRAARHCWARIAELSGAPHAAVQRQHAVTSRPMMTRYDPWVNLLRTTVAAFAAGAGGADAVTVLPYDAALGTSDAGARRWARNISALLISESHVGAVIDPASGSFAVEDLTDQLAEAAWTHFGEIERAGGLANAAELLIDAVAETSGQRQRLVANRRLPITGVSEFPLLTEHLPERDADPTWPRVSSYAGAFEALRDLPAEQTVFLATMGPIAAHTARATFAANLFAAGGVATDAAGPTSTAAELTAAYAGQPVVCLAGSDSAYAEWGHEAVAGLRAAGARWVILAGKPGEATLAADLIDDSCALGLDALAFLHRTRDQLAAGSHQSEVAR